MAVAKIEPATIGPVPERHAPMVALTKPVPAGTTWVDCNHLGKAHRWEQAYQVFGSRSLVTYYRCERCPVRWREEVKH